MSGIPTPIEAIALASAAVSLGCLAIAAFHAIRFEKHQQTEQHQGDKQ